MSTHDPGSDPASRGNEELRIQLLGGFRVVLGERVIEESEWRLRKAAGLLKLLALSERLQLHREQALELLWPDSEPRAAVNNLHGTLHALRRILRSDCQFVWLRLHGDVLSLGPVDRVWVDVRAFEAACIRTRGARDPAPYHAALQLYTGELLPADRYEDWAASRREQVHDKYLTLLVDLARLHEARQELRAAIEALRRVVASERSHEEAHTGLMRLYALSGQRHQALRQYGQMKDAMRRELDAEPEAESERLYRDIRSGLYPPRDSRSSIDPEDPTGPGLQHNLPVPLTSFIGREREIADVGHLLATTRLLTLIGTGGCGKTRLALEVARGSIPEYADGVWLVELAGLSDPHMVPGAVAGVLGITEDSGRGLMDALAHALRARKTLLVLDNCEHLLDACAHLAQTLLGSCPGVQILATSREALGASGELHWRVPSLAVPPAGTLPLADRLGEYGSVRLFVERAQHREPALDLSEDRDMQAVAEICRQLDGIPLAIELATARIPVLSVRQIAERLDDSLGLLTGGGRVAMPRHRTLRGALDWSYALLNEPERQLFAGLSVFAGGWTLEAAEPVGCAAAAGGPRSEDALELLSRLVDRSLVQVEVGQGPWIRYRLLESVRQYARERLEEGGGMEAARRAHARFFVVLAEEAEPELTGPQQAEWLARLEVEHDNARAALAQSLAVGEVEVGARLVAALWRFWWVHGHLSEGREWLGRVLASPCEIPDRVRARALRGASVLAWAQTDYEKAVPLMEQSIALFREVEDADGTANALSNLGTILSSRGDYEGARRRQEEGLDLNRALGNKRGLSLSLANLGDTASYLGDHQAARQYWEETLPLDRELGDLHGVAITVNNLGLLARDVGDLDQARARIDEAVGLFRPLSARSALAQALEGLADVHAHRC
ncbi:MAG: tetratricopeptide repeat protein, partial [Chloroflexia bacterium]|nr:tetratricopeptide repeat protein [Chloroflexia bacterium]